MKRMPHVLTVFGVIGLILLTIGVVGLNNTIQWVTEAERTDGTVVRISAHSTVSDGVTTTMYSPVVIFTAMGAGYLIYVIRKKYISRF